MCRRVKPRRRLNVPKSEAIAWGSLDTSMPLAGRRSSHATAASCGHRDVATRPVIRAAEDPIVRELGGVKNAWPRPTSPGAIRSNSLEVTSST